MTWCVADFVCEVAEMMELQEVTTKLIAGAVGLYMLKKACS